MAWAQPQCDENGCGPVITSVKFAGREAYRFSDGKSEAVVVPSLGRVMSYGLVGGPNLLFDNTQAASKSGDKKLPGWVNWGGDKTWPGPQDGWGLWQKLGGWPPPPEWDGQAHQAEVLTGGKLRTVSGVGPGVGARVVRVYSLDEAGRFVIEQSIEKLSGAPASLSIWSVTQVKQPDAVWVRANPASPYKDAMHWISREAGKSFVAQNASPEAVRIEPSREGTFKIGVDAAPGADSVALASVSGDVAFVQRAARSGGQYPDGALGAGFPIEVYNNATPAYTELEMLSPLRIYSASKDGKGVGTRYTHTVRWSLHKLADPQDQAEIARLLSAD